MPSKKITIGIPLGDPCGIGPEVTAKALQKISGAAIDFQLIGDDAVFRHYHLKQTKHCALINLSKLSAKQLTIGRSNPASAAASLAYLQKAVQLLKNKSIQALVTAPVSKEAISALGVSFHGHTEFLADHFNVKNYEMMFVAPKAPASRATAPGQLKTIIATRHISIKQIPAAVTAQKIYATIELAHRTLRTLFKVKNPHIAVCGLNPHAGERGLIGKEEITAIIPAIQKARRKGWKISGPLPADTLFYPPHAQSYDLIIAMYHDQGLAPIKAMYFNQLVNLTIGLPFIRTSPAHGTAFDIAGKNKADPGSMLAAIRLAAQLTTGKSS